MISLCVQEMGGMENYPRLCGVKVYALDSLGPGKELPLEYRSEMSHVVCQYKGV